MEFGAFLAPWHKVGTDANTAIHQDLQLVEHMDRLGFAEFWIGEHHSGGVEIVASPEMFLAAAAQRTARIKLGLGVVSLPYHNPYMVADRIVLLDHLSRGRAIFGAGPGQLADDAHMIGIDPVQNRRKMEEAFDVIHRLLAGETVTEQTDWYTLKDAYLHVAPYSDIQKAVTATVSPHRTEAGRQVRCRHSVAGRHKPGRSRATRRTLGHRRAARIRERSGDFT